jgi:pimeloyl-ACP methyl ester carboxylesterase
VVEVRRSTGSTWIVQIPGTQAWSPRPGPGDSPFDLAGALALTAGESSSGARLASAALAEAGAAPDEPVLLVGHSQGGMIAAQMAGDPAVRDRFRITHVITAGSPVGVAAIPEDVRVLSLEHDDDLVPHLDGRPNPDRGTWITVHAASPHGASGPLPPHDSQGYVVTARAVDASPDPDLVEYRCGLRPFLDGPGVSVISTDMRAVRTGG